tara:strand:+ start:1729 stop:2544 length:816 start_codon:yes stop_codon:yes gene_type:complete
MAALEAVWDDLRAQGVDKVYCLGDLVGYGPFPNEVIKFIQQYNIPTVLGCWDEGIGMEREDCGCKFITEEDAEHGHAAFEWTRSQVTEANRKFLGDLYFGQRVTETAAGSLLLVHGSPNSTSEYLMESTHDLILFERAAAGDCDVLICGHTHVPFVRKIEGTLKVTAEMGVKDAIQKDLGMVKGAAPREVSLKPKLLVNAGSVGEPRHGGVEATYVIFDTGTKSVEIRGVPYDVESTVRALRKSGLPEAFAERLVRGEELAQKSKEIICAC